jgi:hypothetical protein
MKNNKKIISMGSRRINQGIFSHQRDCHVDSAFILAAMTCLLLLIGGCVAPPDYSDGLLENVPAIVDETDYFSLSLLGDDYSEEKEWELSLTSDSTDTILTTLVLADLSISNTDSSILFMMNDSGDTIFQPILLGNVVWSSEIAIQLIGSPKIISFKGDNFTGRLEYQILKK